MEDRSNHRDLARAAANEPSISLADISWRRLFAYLKPYWWRMALAILALLIANGLGLAFPLLIVRLLDSATTTKSYGALNTLAGALAGMFLIQATFSFFQSYLLTYIGER